MNLGYEYFKKIQKQQAKRVLDKDVEHISYRTHYTQGIDFEEIIEKIQEREKLANARKGKGITD